jgi:hypothetical protein
MGLFNRLFGGGGSTPRNPPPPPPDAGPPEFPYELIQVAGTEAVSRALAWRDEWGEWFTPVILGRTKDLEFLAENLSEVETSPQEILQQARALDLNTWFKHRLGESAALEEVTDESAWSADVGVAEDEGFHAVTDTLSRRIHPWVWVAKVPAAQPSETPAWLNLGGWNACPNASEHVAVWRHWQAKYGAEILCVTTDVIEATVARPPEAKEECYVLAREQFAYCDDIVTQGVGSIDALAAALRNGRRWFFWWD